MLTAIMSVNIGGPPCCMFVLVLAGVLVWLGTRSRGHAHRGAAAQAALPCPTCGHHNLPRARFCARCGADLHRHA